MPLSARLPGMRRLVTMVMAGAMSVGTTAQEPGIVPLFDGTSLQGWVNINCAPDTFGVRDGVITVTGVPICEIRTERMYENFVLELEYQHLQPLGNAGVFVWADALPARGQPFLRAIEVQVLDGRNSETYTSHGDAFAIHGAVLTPDRPHPAGSMRSLPSERRAKGPGEWNHYRITANNGTLKLAVNGKEVSGGYDISPRKGYIALESEGAPVLFRNIRIRELPPSSTPLRPEQVATAYEGHTALYDGKTFTGWTPPAAEAAWWTTNDWTIAWDGKGQTLGQPLRSTSTYRDVEVIADWRWVDKDEPTVAAPAANVPPPPPAGARVSVLTHSGAHVRPAGEWNRVVQRVVGNRLTMIVNGETVLEDAVRDDVPASGGIALVPQGRRVEFANVFVRTLP
jgi:hypothetical protein